LQRLQVPHRSGHFSQLFGIALASASQASHGLPYGGLSDFNPALQGCKIEFEHCRCVQLVPRTICRHWGTFLPDYLSIPLPLKIGGILDFVCHSCDERFAQLKLNHHEP
jgi:hypothetical protein